MDSEAQPTQSTIFRVEAGPAIMQTFDLQFLGRGRQGLATAAVEQID